jgi:tripartite-type tricarboxylate transporter receptor subunit TctC
MSMFKPLIRATLSGLALLLLPVSFCIAQGNYPNKPIRFVVPNPAGGLPDTVARILGQKLGERLGQQIVIDNRPGANGVVAAQNISSSPADGYTFLVTDSSMFTVNPSLYANLAYDAKKDFIPVSLIATAPLYLALHPGVAANSLQEFIALAKAKPGTLTYGSSGVGSTHHLTMESLKTAVGIDVTHVPFKGSGQSVPALIGGQTSAVVSALPSLSGFVKTGQVKLIAVNSLKRSPQAPDVPAIAETVAGFDFAPSIGVLAATGTPAEIVKRISSEIAALVKVPALIDSMNKMGIDPVGGSPEQYAALLKEDGERSAHAIKAAGIKAE